MGVAVFPSRLCMDFFKHLYSKITGETEPAAFLALFPTCFSFRLGVMDVGANNKKEKSQIHFNNLFPPKCTHTLTTSRLQYIERYFLVQV